MRRLSVVLLLMLTAAVNARTIVKPTFVGEPVTLVGTQAWVVFKQCSRSAPSPSAVLPGPTSAEIEQLEQVVERHISIEYEANRLSPPDAASYSRQYVAYQGSAGRMIYGNYYPSSYSAIQGQAVVGCGGGPQFWGVSFDPKSVKIESISFNGSA